MINRSTSPPPSRSRLLCLAAGGAQAQQVQLMTGPQGGSWYPLGGAIANIGDKAGLKVQVLPGAGIANVKAIAGRQGRPGLRQLDLHRRRRRRPRAVRRRRPSNVCNVATLYPQYFQVVANADSRHQVAGRPEGQGAGGAAQGQHGRVHQPAGAARSTA